MLITINHQKGGTSKSITSWNLAIELAKTGKKIEVVDLDIQKTITLNNYVRAKSDLVPLDIKSFKDVASFEKYIDTDNDNKIIVVDTGGYDSGLNRLAVLRADVVITPMSNSTLDLQGLKTYEKIIKELEEKAGFTIIPFVLFGNIDPRTKNLKALTDYIQENGNFKVMESIVCRRSDFVSSITNGKSAVEYKEVSKAAKEITALVNEIKTLLSIQ